MTKKIKIFLKTITEKLLKNLEIEGKVSIEYKDEVYRVTIDTDEAGILIGHHGKSLEAIQAILGQMLYKKFSAWYRVLVSVGDYLERREQHLKNLALEAVDKVLVSKEPLVMSYLSPYERRIIHLVLADHPQVTSESEGEGNLRRLVIKPKA